MKITVAIIQARTNSSRLPGKVLEDICGKSLIQRVYERAASAGVFNTVIVATSDANNDDALAEHCEEHDIPVFRGSLDDVLNRYLGAAEFANADAVVRLTGDCPLLDADVLRDLVKMYETNDYDYVSNVTDRTYPNGVDCEIMSIETLRAAHADALLPSEREHVTPYIHKHPELFRIGYLKQEEDLSELRWTVDELRDLEFVRKVYEAAKKDIFGMDETLLLIKQNPEWVTINQGIPLNEGMQKSYEEDAKFLEGTV